MSIRIGEIIGEGNFRTTYAVKDKDLCLKKHKKYVTKIIYGFKIDFRSKFFIFLKFGISDLNIMEYKAIKKMPAELTPYIPSDIEFVKEEGLVMGRAKDMDGTYSKMMANFGPIHNDAFWEHIERMIKIFEENNIYPSDILYKGNNIIIKKASDEEWIPIIIDFKRMNMGYDLFSRFEFGSKKTFYRRLKRFKKAFKPNL